MGLTLKQLKYELRMGDINYDPWGTAMAALFDVAAELWWRGEDVPAHWEYSPGMVDDPRDRDSCFYELATETDTETLTQFGNLLERFVRNHDRVGNSY
jgi:hypothetical protein